jgi:16S rRNA (adenine1518-N6/adenine1519-N6)-dimethyltransferase
LGSSATYTDERQGVPEPTTLADSPARAEGARPHAASPAVLLRRLGLRPRKRLSQSFLVDRRVCATIARAAELTPTDAVLEIGPGLGVLTAELVRRAGRVTAVELDERLAAAIPELLDHPRNLSVVRADALAIDPAVLVGGDYKVVANLPYHITSPLLRRLLEARPPPRLLVVMVQREVAERIVAPVGQLSYLTISVQLYAQARIVRTVPAAAFHPRPKVESAVLRLDVRPEPAVVAAAPGAFLRLVQAGFKQPRKQIRNSLAEGLGRRPADLDAPLRTAGIDAARRPQALSLQEWARLYEVMSHE